MSNSTHKLTNRQRHLLDELIATYPDIQGDANVTVMYHPLRKHPYLVLINLYTESGANRVHEFAEFSTNEKAWHEVAAVRAYIREKLDTMELSK